MPESKTHTPTVWSGRFVLLADFWSAWDVFPLKTLGRPKALIQDEIVAPMHDVVRDHVEHLDLVTDDQLSDAIASAGLDDAFIITMDGGSYFSRFDFSFEITRAAFQLADVLEGRFFRMPREGKQQFASQTLHVRAEIQERKRHGSVQEVVLCDDGMGTGRSVQEVMNSLSSLGIRVSRIVVLLNPKRLEYVDGVPVQTLIDIADEDFLWLSERDLYWGLPRSGVSLTELNAIDPAFGLPYTIDADMTVARIGLPRDAAEQLRLRSLEINERLWRLLEEHHARPLEFSDCRRIEFVPNYIEVPSARIAECIRSIATNDFELESVISARL